MASLDESVKNIVEIYGKYANPQGKLTVGCLKKMMDEQIKDPSIKAKLCAEGCQKAMGCPDKDKDAEVSCDDFKKLICHMMKCCYEQKSGCKSCDK